MLRAALCLGAATATLVLLVVLAADLTDKHHQSVAARHRWPSPGKSPIADLSSTRREQAARSLPGGGQRRRGGEERRRRSSRPRPVDNPNNSPQDSSSLASPESSQDSVLVILIVVVVVVLVLATVIVLVIRCCLKERDRKLRCCECWNRCTAAAPSATIAPAELPVEDKYLEKSVPMTKSAYQVKLGDTQSAADTFRTFDENRNGLISQAEWMSGFERLSRDGAVVRAVWEDAFGVGKFDLWCAGKENLDVVSWRAVFTTKKSAVRDKEEEAKQSQLVALVEQLAERYQEQKQEGFRIQVVNHCGEALVVPVNRSMLGAEVLILSCQAHAASVKGSELVFSDTKLELCSDLALSGVCDQATLQLVETHPGHNLDDMLRLLQLKLTRPPASPHPEKEEPPFGDFECQRPLPTVTSALDKE